MKGEASGEADASSFHPSRRLGQNFLVDKQIVERIVKALNPTTGETIIEIGPGKGALTERLVERTERLIAIEFDRTLAPALAQRFIQRANFKLLQADALQADFCEAIAPATTARVVANLPYNISTAILQHLTAWGAAIDVTHGPRPNTSCDPANHCVLRIHAVGKEK